MSLPTVICLTYFDILIYFQIILYFFRILKLLINYFNQNLVTNKQNTKVCITFQTHTFSVSCNLIKSFFLFF